MPKTPTYRTRKDYPGKAIVTLTDSATGKRRDYWLGQHGTRASREAYHRLIAAWEASDRRLPDPLLAEERAAAAVSIDAPDGGVVLIKHVIKPYWKSARKYYSPDEVCTLRIALRLLRDLYGSTPAESFGPSKLRLLRDEMVRGNPEADPPRKAWTRNYVNAQCRRIRQLFRWAASHELIPAAVHQGLATIEPLKRGRCEARDNEPVGPVPLEIVEKTKPFLSRQLAAVVDLQLLTGARGGELLRLRAVDINTTDSSGLWSVTLAKHKNAHRGKDRTIYFGPAAQAILSPFMANRPIDAYLFSPREAEAERRAKRRAARKTPLSCGNRAGTNRSASPLRQPGEFYPARAYCHAIKRACERAFPPPPSVTSPAAAAIWRSEHSWHPHQLRHTAASNIRRLHGLEAAQLVLGHSSAKVTDAVYAERDARRVVDVMMKIG